jgi:hypothetical protein
MYIFLNVELYGLYRTLVYVANTFITTRPILRDGRKPSTARYLNLPPVAVHDYRSMYQHLLHTYLPTNMGQRECFETSAYKIQTPGNYPEESIQRDLYLHHKFLHAMYITNVLYTAVRCCSVVLNKISLASRCVS